MARAASPTPSRSKQWKALGPSWMPAPISPSCAAFSSTSEAMPFWASPSAAANPPMPPPAIRTLSRSTYHLVVMELGDLVVGQPEDARQDLVGMLAEHGRRLRRLARGRAELQGRGGDRIAADARLVEHGEHRIVEQVFLVGRQFAEALAGRPQRTRFLKGRADLRCRMRGHPRLDEGAELGAGVPAAGVGLEVDALGGLDFPEGLGEAAGRRQGVDMAIGENADHDEA